MYKIHESLKVNVLVNGSRIE